MSCEETREQLPDYTLGTLSDVEQAAIRRHLRGCAACREEASALDEGVALFASAVHEVHPPPELKGKVMSVLAEEWAEAPAVGRKPPWFFRLPVVAAAALVLVAGALTWGSLAQSKAGRFQEDAASYRGFLHALGGKDVRVASLHPATSIQMEGSAIVYDSDKGMSWVLVLGRSPGYTGSVTVSLSTATGQSISLHATKPDPDGEFSSWLITSSDLARFTTVRLTDQSGRVVATGTTQRAVA